MATGIRCPLFCTLLLSGCAPQQVIPSATSPVSATHTEAPPAPMKSATPDDTRSRRTSVVIDPSGVATFHEVREVAGGSLLSLSGFPRDVQGLWVEGNGLSIVREELSRALAGKKLSEGRAVRVVTEDGGEASDGVLVTLDERDDVVVMRTPNRERAARTHSFRTIQPPLPLSPLQQMLTPTLRLSVQNDSNTPNQLRVFYTTHALGHHMEYVLIKQPSADRALLSGALTLANKTGVAITQAKVTLSDTAASLSGFGSSTARTNATSLNLANLANLDPDTEARFPVFYTREVALSRKIVVAGPGLPREYALGEVGNESTVAVLDAETVDGKQVSDQGMVRGDAELYEKSGGYFGTAGARPLPGGLGLRVQLGADNGLDVRRRLVARRVLKRCVTETSWEIRLHNTTEAPVSYQDVEPVSGTYEVLESSVAVLAKEGDHFAFGGTLQPNAEQRLTFRVRVTGCEAAPVRYWGQYGKPSGWTKESGS